MHFIPLENKILIKFIEPPLKIGSIFLPQNQKESNIAKGKVIAMGDQVKIAAETGKNYYFNKFDAKEITIEGEKHAIITEDNLLAADGSD